MLKKRIITALLAIPVLVVAIWFDKPLPWFTVLVAVWGLLAILEFYRLVAVLKVSPLTGFGRRRDFRYSHARFLLERQTTSSRGPRRFRPPGNLKQNRTECVLFPEGLPVTISGASYSTGELP